MDVLLQATEGPLCASHGQRAAVAACDRCGAFVCEDCRPASGEKCPSCTRREQRVTPGTTWRVRIGLKLVVFAFMGWLAAVIPTGGNMIGLVLGALSLPFSATGVSLAILEVYRTTKAGGTSAGRQQVLTTLWLGTLHVIVVTLALLFVVGLLVMLKIGTR